MNEYLIISKYKEFKNIRKVAFYFHCRAHTVSKILKKNNIDLYQHRGKAVRKYHFNEQYFDTLTNESAYWLGFIAADGCIRNNYLSVELAEIDKSHLFKFKKSLNTEQPIFKKICKNSLRNSKWKDSVNFGIHIHSKYMVNSIKKYNIKEKKSLNFDFSETIYKSNYLNSFCRGYFDGDGGFSNCKGQLTLNFRGTEPFLDKLLFVFKTNNIIYYNKKISFDSGIFRIQFNGNNVCSNIINWMYKDATIFLDRKHEIASKYIYNNLAFK